MPRSRLTNYLRTERLRSGFSQRELGKLFGVSRGAITKAEGTRPPPRDLLLMAETVFGSSQCELFPAMHARLVRDLLSRAISMEHQLLALDDPVSRKKRQFLGKLIERAKAKSPQS